MLQGMLLLLENGMSMMIRPTWITTPSVKMYLMTLRDGVGNFVFRDELSGDDPRLMGHPLKISQQLPSNINTGTTAAPVNNGAYIFMADMKDVVIADTYEIYIDASDVAVYQDTSGAQVSAFRRDQTVFRVISEHDFGLRHQASLAVATVPGWAPTGYTPNGGAAYYVQAPTVTSIVTSGTDQETEDAFKARYLARYASSAQGGSATDYENWALDVPGVTRAWCGSPGLCGDATVPVYVMMDDANASNGGFPRGTNGTSSVDNRYTPATQDLLTVANALQSEKPVTDIVVAMAPQPYPIDITLTGLDGISTDMKTDINAALADLFLRVGTPLGMTVQGSQIAGALNAIPDIPAFSVIAPVGSISVPVGYLPTAAEPTYQ
ncbi:phage major capsid protein [Gluconacetobacter entanii]|uniref:Phage major capsid protein n=1 Tax=Gluconacetobacter entanii TaxID=108528 RepID=A0ABT3K7W9_9PROT|nr:phage major capsid protein [Gluconacetobacter entanii]MCW4595436.1 phage major capsid protein [Gluconacetobacter entanii]NPC89865.1 phage major capsid protein [Gluconacetobacter entanii]